MKWFFIALWGLVSWLAVEVVIFLPLYIFGLPLAWWAQDGARTVEVPSRLYPERAVLAYANPILNWWIGNYEDGVAPEGYSPFRWFVRNPVCNLRFTPVISTLPSPDVDWVGSVGEIPPDGTPGWFLAHAGPYVGFRWQRTTWGVWIGWKINPRDAAGPCNDYRRFGLGTACQLLRFR
ncbi:MAG TPA: hypothetical protein VM537_17495 [Anaerolineae bacterium]|nr:hypothetical protein [Anaerolineae bacterium]